MRIAYVLYNDFTLLDFVGFYDPISRLRSLGYLPDLEWHLCGANATVHDNFGLHISTDRITPNLSAYDLVYVPGGFGSRRQMSNQDFLEWLQTAASVTHLVSVCTGSLLLGAAGLLKAKRATTHFNEYDTLAPYVKEVVAAPIVVDGNTITGGAVAASLDLGLHICKLLAGKDAATAIGKSMNYSKDSTHG